MPSEYPKTVTTNDGLMVYFTCESEEIAAYRAAPNLYHEKPDCVKDEIIKPVVVEKLMKEVVIEKPSAPAEEKKPVGRPKGHSPKR